MQYKFLLSKIKNTFSQNLSWGHLRCKHGNHWRRSCKIIRKFKIL